MIYRFDTFELDPERFELRRAGELQRLPRKSFDLLSYLVARSGRVVTKQELFQQFWRGSHVGESVLPVHVRTIRRTLGLVTSSILHTVRGRGYMIACRVERVDSEPTTAFRAGFVSGRAARRARGDAARDPVREIAQVSGLLTLALGLGDLCLAADSLELLDPRPTP
jgi:DNA-binding winged helix-turn-helix (wHTH) protein